jgi:hypothetical protein
MKINNFLSRVRHGGLIVIGSYRGWKVDQEIQALEDQADELEGRNKRLMEIAQSLGSPERMEVEARKRLGMRKPGEQVVVLEGMSASGSWETQMQLDVVPEKAETPRSNPELWLDYFFRPERL